MYTGMSDTFLHAEAEYRFQRIHESMLRSRKPRRHLLHHRPAERLPE